MSGRGVSGVYWTAFLQGQDIAVVGGGASARGGNVPARCGKESTAPRRDELRLQNMAALEKDPKIRSWNYQVTGIPRKCVESNTLTDTRTGETQSCLVSFLHRRARSSRS